MSGFDCIFCNIEEERIVAIHDGVRPLISTTLINKLVQNTKNDSGVIPIVPVKDSIRKINGITSIRLNRSNLYKVQTPQCFISGNIKEAYAQNFSNTFTDDASVFESTGGNLITVFGEERNIKITTQQDFQLAKIILNRNK